MPLPSPNLDDLRFQHDLVDEARKRIVRYCPEWTEYNLSDPGITLIELFSWMTEMILYRLNQVPEKNYRKFLELLGKQRQPASSARTELTFWLSVALPIAPDNQEPVIVPQGTEVASRRSDGGEDVIFTTDHKLVINPPRLTQLRKEEDFNKNYLERLSVETFHAFGKDQPKPGDTFYLGFDKQVDISGHILRLSFECRQTEAVGVRRDDPPWVWEVSMGDETWREVPLGDSPDERDTTGGLNNPSGSLVLYLPLGIRPDLVFGREAIWIRCRVEERDDKQNMYTQSPRVTAVSAETLGAAVPATHAVIIENEILGTSSGEAGQVFRLQNAPILALQEGETVEVEEIRFNEPVFTPWNVVESFSQSTLHDRVFTIDTAEGEISFGPAVRQPDGSVKQYGRVPETNRQVRFTRYRTGGGTVGNLPADSLQTMTTSLAYIARVTNLIRASGGQDPEDLEEVKLRAQSELQAQLRAVTAEDYELLAKKATRSVARVKCYIPHAVPGAASQQDRLPSGVVELLVVPAAFDALVAGDLSRLRVDDELSREIVNFLDKYRLLTTVLRVREPKYIGVKVHVEVVPSPFQRQEVVRARVLEALQAFISPLSLVKDPEKLDDLMKPNWEGWPFGRSLYLAEIFSLVQRVPGVKHVLDVQLFTQPIHPDDEVSPEDETARKPPLPMDKVEERLIRVAADTLLCSRDHDVIIRGLEGSDAG